jgi:hypothetical protein
MPEGIKRLGMHEVQDWPTRSRSQRLACGAVCGPGRSVTSAIPGRPGEP